jgi:predicted nucleic acid-binding protein
MVTTPRKVEIRDGTITLPEDMLEESGIGTSDGTVIVDLHLLYTCRLGLTQIYTFDRKMNRLPGVARVEP